MGERLPGESARSGRSDSHELATRQGCNNPIANVGAKGFAPVFKVINLEFIRARITDFAFVFQDRVSTPAAIAFFVNGERRPAFSAVHKFKVGLCRYKAGVKVLSFVCCWLIHNSASRAQSLSSCISGEDVNELSRIGGVLPRRNHFTLSLRMSLSAEWRMLQSLE